MIYGKILVQSNDLAFYRKKLVPLSKDQSNDSAFHVPTGVVQLAIALSEEAEDHIQAAAAWALGQIGRHTPEHAKAVAVANVLPKLLAAYLRADASEDLQTKVSRTVVRSAEGVSYGT